MASLCLYTFTRKQNFPEAPPDKPLFIFHWLVMDHMPSPRLEAKATFLEIQSPLSCYLKNNQSLIIKERWNTWISNQRLQCFNTHLQTLQWYGFSYMNMFLLFY